MTFDGKSQPDGRETDPEKLAKLLEIELMQKRASWQQAKARRSSFRVMSFLFLFAVIVAAVLTFYFFLSSDRLPTRDNNPPPTAPP